MSDAKDKRPQDWDEIQTAFNNQPEGNPKALQRLLENFRQDLQQHPYVRRQANQGRESLWLPLSWCKRLAIPVAALVLLLVALTFMSQPAPTWAQVVARFEAVPFFSASIYYKEDGLAQPEHIELWMGQGGLTRMRLGHQLIFAEKGEVQACFDLKTRKQIEPDEIGKTLIQMLGSSDSFSMETLLQAMAQAGVPVNQTPVLNENAIIDEDLVVFDLESDEFPEWIRIWALKKTGLPVRIRVWNPSDAATMEVIFDYSRPQPQRFFDPKAFASALGNIKTDELNLAYLFLEDAGGRMVVPGVANQNEAMNIITTTIDGESFSLSHYNDKILVLYFWDRGMNQRDWAWLREKQRQYADRNDVQFVTVSLDKNADRVKQSIQSNKIDLLVLHEPGKGLGNSLARALGIKQEETFCLLRKGQMWEMQHVRSFREAILTLACDGLDYENSNWVHEFIEMFKTTDTQIRDICGEPHKVEIGDNKTLWFYHLLSRDNKSEKKVYIRFDENHRYSGISMSNRLLRPSHVSVRFDQEYWDEVVVPVMGTEDSDDQPLEIAFAQDNVSSMIGGGHPRKIIEPGRWYDRELEDGQYLLRLQIMDRKEYRRIKELDLINELTIAPSEDVRIVFSNGNGPEVTRSVYQPETGDRTSIAKAYLLKKPDYKQMFKEANEKQSAYDDPKFIPWQLHLKDIAARYETHPLPEKMELILKETDESYALIMFPKDLPGHEGYSARSLEGNVKRGTGYRPLLVRWPEDTPNMELNHDFVYQNDVKLDEQFTFLLESLGYRIESVIEERTVYVATYDGRSLPDPNEVSAPNVGGWGYATAKGMLDMLTRRNNPIDDPNGPVFIDETGLPSEPGPGQSFKDIAISMEMPGSETDWDTLKTWFAETFGITFTQETRPMEVLVIRKDDR